VSWFVLILPGGAASRAAKARWATRWAVPEARRQIGEVLRRVRRVPVRPLIPATPPPRARGIRRCRRGRASHAGMRRRRIGGRLSLTGNCRTRTDSPSCSVVEGRLSSKSQPRRAAQHDALSSHSLLAGCLVAGEYCPTGLRRLVLRGGGTMHCHTTRQRCESDGAAAPRPRCGRRASWLLWHREPSCVALSSSPSWPP